MDSPSLKGGRIQGMKSKGGGEKISTPPPRLEIELPFPWPRIGYALPCLLSSVG